MDESRKQFYEAFEVLTGWEVNDCPNRHVARLCHQMWEMSRAAIEIELPKRIGSKSSWQEGPHMFADDVVSAIRAAGIKVKE